MRTCHPPEPVALLPSADRTRGGCACFPLPCRKIATANPSPSARLQRRTVAPVALSPSAAWWREPSEPVGRLSEPVGTVAEPVPVRTCRPVATAHRNATGRAVNRDGREPVGGTGTQRRAVVARLARTRRQIVRTESRRTRDNLKRFEFTPLRISRRVCYTSRVARSNGK